VPFGRVFDVSPHAAMESQSRMQVALLALLVVSAITGVYLFFQSAPEAELYVHQRAQTLSGTIVPVEILTSC